jgi:hypothetical protein
MIINISNESKIRVYVNIKESSIGLKAIRIKNKLLLLNCY